MRSPREIVPDQPHHIILQGNNKRRIVSYPWEYKLLISLIGRSAQMHGVLIHALCILANHLHMVMRPPSKDAGSLFVKGFAQPYAQQRNVLREGSGKLFKERFDCHVIDSESYLAVATAYVDRNASHHRLVAHPSEYGWSTYGLHVGRPELSKLPSGLWTPSDWYLGLGPARCEVYREWVDDCQAHDRELPPPPSTKGVRRPNGSSAI
jgi:putative transposase